MSEAVWVAIITAITTGFMTTIPPMVKSIIDARIRTRERQEDIARQTGIAQRASAERAAGAVKLEEIHGLVNGNLLSARRAEHAALVTLIGVLRENIVLRAKAGELISPEILEILDSNEKHAGELKLYLDRSPS